MLRSELAMLLHSIYLMTVFVRPLSISLLVFCSLPLHLQLPNYKVLLPKAPSLAIFGHVYKPTCINHFNTVSFCCQCCKASADRVPTSPELPANISSCLLGIFMEKKKKSNFNSCSKPF